MELEDLSVLRNTERIADEVWTRVIQWDSMSRHVVGEQLARAADSIGANIAESWGRFNYGEKIQFLYYARGSLYETKYWLNRATVRKLIATHEAETYATQLTAIARQINSFASTLKTARNGARVQTKAIREETAPYYIAIQPDSDSVLIDDNTMQWLETIPSPHPD